MLAISPASSIGMMSLGAAAATYRIFSESFTAPGFGTGGDVLFTDYNAAKDAWLNTVVDIQSPKNGGAKPTAFYAVMYRVGPTKLLLASVGKPTQAPADLIGSGLPESPPVFEPAIDTPQSAISAPFYKNPIVLAGAAAVVLGLGIFLVRRAR
jgi:hypothetical protein